MTSVPSDLKTSSELAVNFVPRSRTRNFIGRPVSGQVADQVPGDLGDECVARVFGGTEEAGLPGGVLESEQDVEPLEEHRAHGEKARGQDTFRLGPEELRPARASARRRPQTMAAEDTPDRRRPDPDAKLGQLALDTYTTPAVVLPAQAHDQLHQFGSHRRLSRASLASPRPPLAPSGFSVPTQQRRRRDQESLPPVAREEPAEGGQEGAVGPSAPGAAMDLALKDAQPGAGGPQARRPCQLRNAGTRPRATGPGTALGAQEKRPRPMLTGSGANCQLRTMIEVLAPFTTSAATTTTPKPNKPYVSPWSPTRL
jgi:hypothetical protein